MYFSDDSLFSKNEPPFTVGASRWRLTRALLCLCILFSACAAHYYQVNDPVTGKTYYTDDLRKIEGDGVELKDARTGETVIIQNSEAREITEYEYDTARLRSRTPPY